MRSPRPVRLRDRDAALGAIAAWADADQPTAAEVCDPDLAKRERDPVRLPTDADRLDHPVPTRGDSLTVPEPSLLTQTEPPPNARGRARCAEAVETQLGDERIGGLRSDLAQLREAIEAQLSSG